MLKLLFIVLVVAGVNPFDFLGLATPSVWNWTQENKFYACLMTFFLCNAIEGQLVSTGAFEIKFNGKPAARNTVRGLTIYCACLDVPLWSKLETGRIPQPPELFQMIDNHLNMNNGPHSGFLHGDSPRL